VYNSLGNVYLVNICNPRVRECSNAKKENELKI